VHVPVRNGNHSFTLVAMIWKSAERGVLIMPRREL
jgi:hypothetical protein